MGWLRNYRLLLVAVLVALLVVIAKYILHRSGWERLEVTALHGSLISGVIFVLGFLMSATISDYKEAERIPAEVASSIQNMLDDANSIKAVYADFAVADYQSKLLKVARDFAADARSSRNQQVVNSLTDLMATYATMEQAGVPANFIVKLKSQQAIILRHSMRVNYIQAIHFIPSATLLAQSIVVLAIGILLLTKTSPFYAGLVMTGAISFILVYVLQLLQVMRTPFHDEGKTRDDVSLFLLDRFNTKL